MPRPDYIAQLHEAKYELRFSSGTEKPELFIKYKAALENASKLSNLPGPQVEAAVSKDFGIWVKQEKLPKVLPLG